MNASFEKLSQRKNLTKEEKEIISNCREMNKRHGFDFVEGWEVDIYKHKCGHREILQHPPKATTKKQMHEEALKRVCTRCTCRR